MNIAIRNTIVMIIYLALIPEITYSMRQGDFDISKLKVNQSEFNISLNWYVNHYSFQQVENAFEQDFLEEDVSPLIISNLKICLNRLNQTQKKEAMGRMLALYLHSSGKGSRGDNISDLFCQHPDWFFNENGFKSNILDRVRKKTPSSPSFEGEFTSQKKYFIYAAAAAISVSGIVLCYRGWREWQFSVKRKITKKRQVVAKKQLCVGMLLILVGGGIGTYTYCYL